MSFYLQNRLLCVIATLSLAIPSGAHAMAEELQPTLESILTCPDYSPAGKLILDYSRFNDIDHIHQVNRKLRSAWSRDTIIHLVCNWGGLSMLKKLANFAIESKNRIRLSLSIADSLQTSWLTKNAKNLSKLNVEDLSLFCHASAELGQLCSLWPSVKSLRLSYFDHTFVPSELHQLKQLTVLVIDCLNDLPLTTDAVAHLCTYCPGLKTLVLTDNGEGFIPLPPEIQSLKDLTKLYVPYSGHDHENIVNILRMCPRLTELGLISNTGYMAEEQDQIKQLVHEHAPNTLLKFGFIRSAR